MLYTCKECGKIHKRCELEQCVFRLKIHRNNKLVVYEYSDCGNDIFKLSKLTN